VAQVTNDEILVAIQIMIPTGSNFFLNFNFLIYAVASAVIR